MPLVKNLAKDGSYYWVITEFEPRRDAIDKIIPVYEKLVELEESSDMKASEKYLRDF